MHPELCYEAIEGSVQQLTKAVGKAVRESEREREWCCAVAPLPACCEEEARLWCGWTGEVE